MHVPQRRGNTQPATPDERLQSATSVSRHSGIEDDAAQLAAAKRVIGRRVANGSTLFVPVPVVLELDWVLRSNFGFSKANVLMTFVQPLLGNRVHV